MNELSKYKLQYEELRSKRTTKKPAIKTKSKPSTRVLAKRPSVRRNHPHNYSISSLFNQVSRSVDQYLGLDHQGLKKHKHRK